MDEMLEKLAHVAAENGIDLSELSNEQIEEILAEAMGLEKNASDDSTDDSYLEKVAEAENLGEVMANSFAARLEEIEFYNSLSEQDANFVSEFEKVASEVAEDMLVAADDILTKLAGSQDDAVKMEVLAALIEELESSRSLNDFEKVASASDENDIDDLIALRALELLDDNGFDADAIINLLG